MKIFSKRTIQIMLLICCFGSMVFTSPATAKNCSKYARDAVNAQNINRTLKCGYSGFGWTGSYAAHQAWCTIAPASQVRSAANTRRQSMNSCRARANASSGQKNKRTRNSNRNNNRGQGGNTVAYCNGYAAQAVKDQKVFTKNHCRYTWMYGFKRNYDYCIKKPKRTTEGVWNNRTKMLKLCTRVAKKKAPGSTIDPVCQVFADRMTIVHSIWEKKCGYGHSKRKEHIAYCMKLKPKERKSVGNAYIQHIKKNILTDRCI